MARDQIHFLQMLSSLNTTQTHASKTDVQEHNVLITVQYCNWSFSASVHASRSRICLHRKALIENATKIHACKTLVITLNTFWNRFRLPGLENPLHPLQDGFKPPQANNGWSWKLQTANPKTLKPRQTQILKLQGLPTQTNLAWYNNASAS